MDERTIQATRLWTLAVPTVSAFVGTLVRDFQDRDDILQEVAVAVLESFESYDPSLPFIGWVIGIARNQVRLFFRRQGRSRVVFDSETVEALARAFEDDRQFEARLDHLTACVEALEPKARELCRLRYQQDLKPAAIGQKLGLGGNAIAKALQRIRDRLRDCIDRKAALAEVAR